MLRSMDVREISKAIVHLPKRHMVRLFNLAIEQSITIFTQIPCAMS